MLELKEFVELFEDMDITDDVVHLGAALTDPSHTIRKTAQTLMSNGFNNLTTDMVYDLWIGDFTKVEDFVEHLCSPVRQVREAAERRTKELECK